MNIFFASITIVNVLLSVVTPVMESPQSTVDCRPHYLENFYLPGWVTNDTWYREMPQYTTGKAVWYAPGLMNSTAKWRGMSLKGFKGGVATNSAGMMGKVAWLKRAGSSWEGPYLIVDVSQRNHAYHHATNVKTIVEVDFPTAIEWDIVSYNKSAKKGYQINRWSEKDVEMWIGLEPPASLDEPPIVYEDWYKDNAEFCDGEPNRRWYLQDWMIKNYDQYLSEINKAIVPAKIESPVASVPAIDMQLLMTKRYVDIHAMMQEIATQLKAIRRTTASKAEIVTTSTAPQPAPLPLEPKIIKVHTLQSHETWTHLSLRYYGSTTEPYWRIIYEANKDMVGDDYRRIWGGMEIEIPELPAGFSP